MIVEFREEDKKISLSMKALLATPEEDKAADDAEFADVDIDAVANEMEETEE